MIEIPVRVCGDHWLNPEEVQEKLLTADHNQTIYLDLGAEGPSLRELGVIDMLLRHCDQTGRAYDSIFIKNWPNPVEKTQFNHKQAHHYSHFFWHSDLYWVDPVPSTHEKLFGFFLGRKTIPRMVMLHDLYQRQARNCLFSVMRTHVSLPWVNPRYGIDLETLDQWVPLDQTHSFQKWWDRCPVQSLDGHDVRDQYEPGKNTNLDILSHYHRFDIELVAETYTRGTAFFPTEKTVRPMVAMKPMLIHGPRHFVKHLQELGFKTWHTVWDESYDQLEGPDRWTRIQAVMDDISALSLAQRQELLAQCEPIVQHNRLVLENLVTRARPR